MHIKRSPPPLLPFTRSFLPAFVMIDEKYHSGIVSADTVPRVNLSATHERALGVVTLAQLKEFADRKVNDMF